MTAVIFDMDGVLVDSEAVYQYDLMRFFREQKQRITSEKQVLLSGAAMHSIIGIWENCGNRR